MKTVILAGGYGTRISEETDNKPKPMVEVGGKPILWHIMKIYSFYGIKEFLICCGYKGYVIKEYFANYFLHMSDVTISLKDNSMDIHHERAEPWKITLIDTGLETMTGGRIKRIGEYVEKEDMFCLTYGDGLSDINIKELIKFHKKEKRLATVTAVYPSGRFGTLNLAENRVVSFQEKPEGDASLVNGGFFVLSPKILNYIDDDTTIWEREPLESLAKDNELSAYIHEGFWYPMDTLRDKLYLEECWSKDRAFWKKW